MFEKGASDRNSQTVQCAGRLKWLIGQMVKGKGLGLGVGPGDALFFFLWSYKMWWAFLCLTSLLVWQFLMSIE